MCGIFASCMKEYAVRSTVKKATLGIVSVKIIIAMISAMLHS